MINTKLLLLEYTTHNHNEEGIARIAAIQSIRKIVSQIDFTAEEVPIDNPHRLIKLLVSLKGEQLNDHELNIVKEIATKQTI